jgi:tRNA threonylcarbamoyladenosine biosynthesis protein TsaB
LTDTAEPRLLILETSGRAGQVALARGGVLLGARRLDEARRHARDLAPAVRELLAEQGWRPRDLSAVLVSRGPGSYTGLRVGIMSAKALAYATGCALLALDTFAAIACQAHDDALLLDVVADAQQDKVYAERFGRDAPDAPFRSTVALTILSFPEWLARLGEGVWVSGPGLRGHEARLPPGTPVVPPETWDPKPESLLRLGLPRFLRGESDDVYAVEPLYLRRSSAEEQWDARKA